MSAGLPAPEQCRSWIGYIQLAKQQLDKENFVYYTKEHRFGGHRQWTLKQYFDACWADSDAELLHKSWQ
jgi:hypothetical protein